MKKTIFIQDENALWLKGNIHSHTVFSDGICSTAYATASVSSSPKSRKRLPHFSAGLV